MKILIVCLSLLLVSCENNSYTVTEDMLLCNGKIYTEDNKHIYVKCSDGKHYNITARKYRFSMEQE